MTPSHILFQFLHSSELYLPHISFVWFSNIFAWFFYSQLYMNANVCDSVYYSWIYERSQHSNKSKTTQLKSERTCLLLYYSTWFYLRQHITSHIPFNEYTQFIYTHRNDFSLLMYFSYFLSISFLFVALFTYMRFTNVCDM